MAEAHLDHSGETVWYPGHQPITPIGLCPHAHCKHELQRRVAEGPDFDHYELVQCDDVDGCAGRCRAWFGEYPDGYPQRYRQWAFQQVLASAAPARDAAEDQQ